MRIIIPTCDRYRNLLEANKKTLEWKGGADLDVTVIGYKKPDFDLGNWKFVSLGTDRGPWFYSDDMGTFFETFEDEYFIYMNDDVVHISQIEFNYLDDLLSFAKTTPNFGRIWLTYGYPHDYGQGIVVKTFGDNYIKEIQQTEMYRLSLQCSLWKTSYFKRYIRPGLRPWDWETRNDAINDGAGIFLSVNKYVFNLGHIMRQGNFIENWYKSFNRDEMLNSQEIAEIIKIFKKHKFI